MKIQIQYGEAAAVGRELGVTRQAAMKGIKSMTPKYLNALARVRKLAAKERHQAVQNLARATEHFS